MSGLPFLNDIFLSGVRVYWEIRPSLSISSALNWHVIKECYMGEREGACEAEGEREAVSKKWVPAQS